MLTRLTATKYVMLLVVSGVFAQTSMAAIVVQRLAVSPETPTGWRNVTSNEVIINQVAKTVSVE